MSAPLFHPFGPAPTADTGTPTEQPSASASTSARADRDREREAVEQRAAVEVDVRLQALDRLRLMSVYFANHAWDRRRGDPLAPHCLAFLFVHRDPVRPGRLLLSAAWRMWIDEPDVRSLPHLLNTLNKQWAHSACGDGFDIRTELAYGCDKQPTDTAVVYAGLGVISLDTAAGTWEQARLSARGAADIPAEIRIVLTDNTTIVAQRLARKDFDDFHVVSTEPLTQGYARPHYPHKTRELAMLQADERHRQVLRWTQELSDTLSQADNHRLAAQQRQAAPKRPGHRA